MSEYYFTIGKGDNTHEVSVDIDLTAVGGKEHKKHMNKTVLNTSSSNTKQATLSYKKQLILSQLAKNLNQKSSQGLICYESLHFIYDCFEDEITIFENRIDKELESYNIDVYKINNILYNKQYIIFLIGFHDNVYI